jgi:hypothetical protein
VAYELECSSSEYLNLWECFDFGVSFSFVTSLVAGRRILKMASSSLLQKSSGQRNISQVAAEILNQCVFMEKKCQKNGTALPTLSAGTSTAFWSESSPELIAARASAVGLLQELTTLLQGPHDYLHELVASNWDHGALYAFFQSQILDYMASSGGLATLSSLSQQSGIPEDKLVRILGLLRCRNIVQMTETGDFALTVVSEGLLLDSDFKAWVEFQYVFSSFHPGRHSKEE